MDLYLFFWRYCLLPRIGECLRLKFYASILYNIPWRTSSGVAVSVTFSKDHHWDASAPFIKHNNIRNTTIDKSEWRFLYLKLCFFKLLGFKISTPLVNPPRGYERSICYGNMRTKLQKSYCNLKSAEDTILWNKLISDNKWHSKHIYQITKIGLSIFILRVHTIKCCG